MTREEWARLWMHVPWGMLAVGLFVYHPLLGVVACFSELAYEAFNDWRKHDESYKDVVGSTWGILIGGYILLALKLLGVIA